MSHPEYILCGFEHEACPSGNMHFDVNSTLSRVEKCLLRKSGNNPLCAHIDLSFPEDDFSFYKDLEARIATVGDVELSERAKDLTSLKHIVDNYKRSSEILYYMPSLYRDIPQSFVEETVIFDALREIQVILERCGIIGGGDNPHPNKLNIGQKNRLNFLIIKIQREIQKLYEILIIELETQEAEKIRTQLN